VTCAAELPSPLPPSLVVLAVTLISAFDLSGE
jgi:hypothetical protein